MGMSNIKRLKIILSAVFFTVLIMLGFNIQYNYQKQYRITINTYLELEATIIKEAARVSKFWFYKRIADKDASIDKIEQEIFTEFINPIHLLKNGDAWIYNKNYVIFDKSSDFPDKYRGKSMREIFSIQKELGAYHYEEMVKGVENATEGKGWYVWLPEKGKEWVAWTSFKFNNQTWTLGLSTPEKEILEYSNIGLILIRQIIYAAVILMIILSVSVFIIQFQMKQDKLIIKINDVNKALKNIDSMKNEFIANISHDFRIPLTIIFNLAELNLTGKSDLPHELKEDLSVIYKTSYQFLSKINTLLDLTKLETSGLKLRIARLNLNDFISRITDYQKSALKHTGISVSLKLPDTVYDNFYTDIEKLEDIINNLLSNAVKFTDRDKGIIMIEVKETLSSAEIRITDNGIGIEEKDLNVIFNRYKQAGKSYSMEYRGSGIGLSYSRQLAELLGGRIKAESAGINLGSVFTLSIDKNKFSADDVDPDDELKQYIPGKVIIDIDSHDRSNINTIITETNRQNEFNPYKGIILIVEDEFAIREIILRYLKDAGYKNFITACDGKTAFELTNKYYPDLVITDLKMPDMNGDEFYAKVCQSPDLSFIPFIFVSAIADEKIILDQKTRGAVDYLLKPIKRNELLASVNMNMKKYMDFTKVSAIDELTGLLNRRVFFKYFENISLDPAASDLSFIILDLDHFKSVNDSYGHQAGDYILSTVCSTIINVVRSQDIAGRYGGEEFGIILPDTNIENALIVAEKIRVAIGNMDHDYQGNKIRITLSAGISSLSQCNKTAENQDVKINYISELTDMADTALYYAKSAKCLTCAFTSNGDTVSEGSECPLCGGEIISGRNRVEIFKHDMPSFIR